MEGRASDGLVQHVLVMAQEHALWNTEDCIVVAVSGGPDSVALLHVLSEISRLHTPLQLVCAHVHHGFRPQESDAEADMVRAFASALHIPFEMIRVDVPAYIKTSGKGSQEAARELRYEFLHDVASRWGAKHIALAHHGDDQAETVLLHLLRGSGPGGLTGMRFARQDKKVQLIRPLLRMYKADLVKWCEDHDLPYVTDSSNLKRKYTRNAIRMDVLPFLGQYNGQLTQSLNRLADMMGAENDHMESATLVAYEGMVRREAGRLVLSIPLFRKLSVALQRRLIKLILNYLPSDSENLDFHKIETVRLKLLQERPSTWTLNLGGSTVGIREYDLMAFFNLVPQGSSGYYYELDSLTDTGRLEIPEAGGILTWKLLEDYDLAEQPTGKNEAVFDPAQLAFPLVIRARAPGDTMSVMGLNGSKKVKDIFIDEKIPPSLRHVIPIVCDRSGTPVWIPGVRRSAHAAVQKHPSSVIYMSWHRRESPEQR